MELTTEQKWFIAALRDFLNSEAQKAETSTEGAGNLAAVWALSCIHSVLPMVYDAAARLKPDPANAELLSQWRQKAFHIACAQAVKSQMFLRLYRAFNNAGIKVLVTKGILCRELYPQPDYRTSSDEDLFADEKDFPLIDKIMSEHGMKSDEAQEESGAQVVTYINTSNGLRIELHRQLFSSGSKAYGGLDAVFADSAARAVQVEIGGVPVWSMNPTDHMLYLFFHAFKHFLHGGFGIRQTCDINMFAKAYSAQIDWAHVSRVLRSRRADCFAASILKIGAEYLGFEDKKYISAESPDVGDLLADILAAGIYGSSSEDRKHSSLITLSAATSPESSEKKHVLKTLFPSAEPLRGKYSYLNKRPWLLPAAWVQRMAGYIGKGDASPSQSLRIGKARVELLRKYRIIS